ncbi:MAG TPA: SIR2 family protein, partial [Blastocatellia bacterium]|nr:SIR2 family protein [Blastocatellia bacterium]
MGSLSDSRPNKMAQEGLAEVVKSERPLALVGAGLSVSAGFPSWPNLLDHMAENLPPLFNDHYMQALRNEKDLLWRAEAYRQMMAPGTYPLLLQTTFGRTFNLRPSDPAVALVKLPFRHFMTTNYDDVLLKAHEAAKLAPPAVLHWSRDGDARKFIFGLRNDRTARTLLHLHGHHNDPASIILTDNDYTERYVRTLDTARRLFAVFATEQIVFVGFSLNDPDLMALLREVNAMMRAESPRHYAIMGLDHPAEEMVARNRLRNRYGVEPVFYDNSDQTHGGLIEILNFLHQHMSKTKTAKKQPPVTRRATPETVKAAEAVVKFDPEDPQKGMWGGLAKANGRQVTAKISELEP